MKKLLVIIASLLIFTGLKAQNISYIETTKSWYNIFDQKGKKIKTLSVSVGELQGYGATFFIVRNHSWYNIYDAKGKKTKTMSVSTVGKILSVSGDTFTSQSGSWIYTWSKDGKKISTRAAKK